ncbi:glycosyltransferase family 4 protein [Sinorhizobium numidicum]|uniref:glycosyltransferase family 4 protein n=1 Tax=Sinorhizobium numidicum TaxID=680248 RepID=UPI003CC8A31D
MVVPIGCTLPLRQKMAAALHSRLPGSRVTAHRTPAVMKARSLRIATAIENAGNLDGIIAMGTDTYDLAAAMRGRHTPIATYDDGTFALFLRYPDSDLSSLGLPSSKVDAWVRLQETACRRATIACVSTEWARKSVVQDFGVPPERVRVVGMGHRPRSNPEIKRSFENPRFLFVGVDWKRKNGAAVLDAFARVHEKFPRATLAVVGKHPPLRQAGVTGYGFLAREDPRGQKILDQLFAQSTAFVLPSLFDPSPIAYLEAASCGLPVIATTRGGGGELLCDGSIRVDPYDRDSLVEAMLRLCDGEEASSMGARALARSATSRWQDVCRRIVDGLMGADEQSNSAARIETR